MRIFVLSITHQTAGVELRERLSLSGPRLGPALHALGQRYPDTERVILSTCNRTELYLARPSHEAPTSQQLLAFLAEFCRVEADQLKTAAVMHLNETAVTHLFRVASGLESMVLGEPQVLGQVKQAYGLAKSHGAVGPVLHRVFQQAIRVAKKVRTDTGIDSGRVSIGSVAVDFARRIFDRFDDKTVVGIGAGKMTELALRHLQALNPATVWLVNRSALRARALADRLNLDGANGGYRPMSALGPTLVKADIVLSGTGSTQPIITADLFKSLVHLRRSRPLFVIDIAVPRDVEPEVSRFKNVYLYNIDDLQQVVEATQTQRTELAQRCSPVLHDAVTACMKEVHNQEINHVIRAFRERLHELGRAEQDRTLRKIAATPGQDLADLLPNLLDNHTRRLINKVLHPPLSHLNRHGPDNPAHFYAEALCRLFGLDLDPSASSTPKGSTITTNPPVQPAGIANRPTVHLGVDKRVATPPR